MPARLYPFFGTEQEERFANRPYGTRRTEGGWSFLLNPLQVDKPSYTIPPAGDWQPDIGFLPHFLVSCGTGNDLLLFNL